MDQTIALRIELILKHYKLNASSFSDMLQIQRSALSHIFSGRNKPSLDVIQKILSSFPDINPGWLLTGIGKMQINLELPDSSFTEVIPESDLNKLPPVIKNTGNKHLPHELFDNTRPTGSTLNLFEQPKEQILTEQEAPILPKTMQNEKKPETALSMPNENNDQAKKIDPKGIERILVFYTDKTFSVYLPE